LYYHLYEQSFPPFSWDLALSSQRYFYVFS
jgi:hypothetical protein